MPVRIKEGESTSATFVGMMFVDRDNGTAMEKSLMISVILKKKARLTPGHSQVTNGHHPKGNGIGIQC